MQEQIPATVRDEGTPRRRTCRDAGVLGTHTHEPRNAEQRKASNLPRGLAALCLSVYDCVPGCVPLRVFAGSRVSAAPAQTRRGSEHLLPSVGACRLLSWSGLRALQWLLSAGSAAAGREPEHVPPAGPGL